MPGSIRRAEHFVGFLKRFTEYLKVSRVSGVGVASCHVTNRASCVGVASCHVTSRVLHVILNKYMYEWLW